MRLRSPLPALLLLVACGRSEAPAESASEPPKTTNTVAAQHDASTTKAIACARQAFAESTELAEASGATFLSDESILMIGDSGTKGAFALLEAKGGKVLRSGNLALDNKASDDLEGVSHMDGKVFAITSSGWMRRWSQSEEGFRLDQDSYALAPHDERGLVCSSGKATNCAKNYEGLCLLPESPAAGQCAGFAAAKATGELICLTSDTAGRLHLDASRIIKVAKARSLSGCDFDDQGRLWFGNNFFSVNQIGYVENWQSPGKARITKLGSAGLGFAEGIAVDKDGLVIRPSDTSGSPSLLSKYICR